MSSQYRIYWWKHVYNLVYCFMRSLTCVARKTRVISRIGCCSTRYQKHASRRLLLCKNIDASSLRVIYQMAILVPVDERRCVADNLGGASEIDFASTFVVHMRIREDSCFGHCDANEKNGIWTCEFACMKEEVQNMLIRICTSSTSTLF